jgi:hypothetical protein
VNGPPIPPSDEEMPTPPSEEEVREMMDAFGVTEEVARAMIGAVLLDGTELPNGEIITV